MEGGNVVDVSTYRKEGSGAEERREERRKEGMGGMNREFLMLDGCLMDA